MLYQFQYPEEAAAWEAAERLLEECLRLGRRERPELRWLKNVYEERRREYRLDKASMDAFLYQRIHGHVPEKSSRILKIRYWRTGHHVPVNRNMGLAFAQALELPPEQVRYLLMEWMDKSEEVWESVPGSEQSIYWERRERLKTLSEGYRESAGSVFKAEPNNLRHLYYMDALQYIRQDSSSDFWKKHIYSTRYDMELKRSLMLLGEIPRKTMIRHLILFGLPDLSLSWINEQLSFLGYLPLRAEHTLTGGEHLDRLLIGLLEEYEKLRNAQGPSAARRWFLHCYRRLDACLVEQKKPALRFMYFKSLD